MTKERENMEAARKPEEDGGHVELRIGESNVGERRPLIPASPAPYKPPAPTTDSLKDAEEVLKALRKDAEELGPEAVVSSLIAIIEVIPPFTTPDVWPGKDDEEYFTPAQAPAAIGELLIRGNKLLTVKHADLVYLWRNKEKWSSKGKTVRGKTVSLNTRAAFLSGGKRAVIEINFHHWKTINPLKRVSLMYRQLRSLDGVGATSRPPDFTGYFDELELFGSRVFRDTVTLEHSFNTGREKSYPHQLPLFDAEGVPEGGE